jgi:hypothetical protein
MSVYVDCMCHLAHLVTENMIEMTLFLRLHTQTHRPTTVRYCMKFITPGRIFLIGPGPFYVNVDSLVRISQKPHSRYPLSLASLDSVTGHLQVFSILFAAAEAWSASLRVLGSSRA